MSKIIEFEGQRYNYSEFDLLHNLPRGFTGRVFIMGYCTLRGVSDVHHPLYKTWQGMIKRCHSPNSSGYKNYGGRGIFVCHQWFYSFETFASDVGPKPGVDYSLDRIDNDKGYEKSNCRWATQRTQMLNTSRTLSSDLKSRIINLYELGVTRDQIMSVLGLPKNKVYNVVRRHRKGSLLY